MSSKTSPHPSEHGFRDRLPPSERGDSLVDHPVWTLKYPSVPGPYDTFSGQIGGPTDTFSGRIGALQKQTPFPPTDA